MRILFLHDCPGISGGATQYLGLLVRTLSAQGHKCGLFFLGHGAPALAAEHFSYDYPWSRWSAVRRYQFHVRHRPLARALRSAAAAFRPDLVHVQNWGVFRTTVFPELGRWPSPAVMTVHDFTLIDPNPWGLDRTGSFGRLRESMDERSLLRAQEAVFQSVDLFFAPSQALTDAIPFPPSKVRLLRPPIAPAEAGPFEPGPLRILFAGSLYASKAVDLLLEALAEVTDARLEIAGEGEEEPALRAQALALGIGERVSFLGHCDAEAMDAAYRRAHVLALPSRVVENSPLVILEAGSRGRPAVAAHAGGVPELVEPPARGWTFPAGDVGELAAALREIASDPQEAAARGRRMAAWVQEHCDPQQHWEHLLAAYRELTA